MDETTPFEPTRVLDPYPLERVNNQALRKLRAAFPMFEQARVAQQWAGMIDVTPDAVPVISPVELVPGFFIATGISGHGFGIGPAAGRLAADLVSGRHAGRRSCAVSVATVPGRFAGAGDGRGIDQG